MVLADNASSCRANRHLLCDRGIMSVIPERAGQITNRKRRGSRGGRPVVFDVVTCKDRNVVERFLKGLPSSGA